MPHATRTQSPLDIYTQCLPLARAIREIYRTGLEQETIGTQRILEMVQLQLGGP